MPVKIDGESSRTSVRHIMDCLNTPNSAVATDSSAQGDNIPRFPRPFGGSEFSVRHPNARRIRKFHIANPPDAARIRGVTGIRRLVEASVVLPVLGIFG